MPFQGMDPVEVEIGCRVQLMTADQLIAYIKMYMKAMHEIDLMVEGSGHRERSSFQRLKRVYGPDAGLIVKWVLWNYDGVWKGEYLNFFSFSAGRKWWTDQMYSEMQVHKRELQKKSTPYEKPGFASMEDL